jgi:hypothetical protein
MKTSFPTFGQVFANVCQEYVARITLFLLAGFIGLNLAAIYQKQEIVVSAAFPIMATVTLFGWLFSLRLLCLLLATWIALFEILYAESHETVAVSLGVVCAAWCSIGLILFSVF